MTVKISRVRYCEQVPLTYKPNSGFTSMQWLLLEKKSKIPNKKLYIHVSDPSKFCTIMLCMNIFLQIIQYKSCHTKLHMAMNPNLFTFQ